jgi:peptide alpha-N-acetyltransferase
MADTQHPSPLASEAANLPSSAGTSPVVDDDIVISQYQDERQLQSISDLISGMLSEPYSAFTYRFFLNGWPQYCLLAHSREKLVGVIICKAERHVKRAMRMRGYIAMLAVDQTFRKRGLGKRLVCAAVHRMAAECDEVRAHPDREVLRV